MLTCTSPHNKPVKWTRLDGRPLESPMFEQMGGNFRKTLTFMIALVADGGVYDCHVGENSDNVTITVITPTTSMYVCVFVYSLICFQSKRLRKWLLERMLPSKCCTMSCIPIYYIELLALKLGSLLLCVWVGEYVCGLSLQSKWRLYREVHIYWFNPLFK